MSKFLLSLLVLTSFNSAFASVKLLIECSGTYEHKRDGYLKDMKEYNNKTYTFSFKKGLDNAFDNFASIYIGDVVSFPEGYGQDFVVGANIILSFNEINGTNYFSMGLNTPTYASKSLEVHNSADSGFLDISNGTVHSDLITSIKVREGASNDTIVVQASCKAESI